jgi:hypothetical protein
MVSCDSDPTIISAAPPALLPYVVCWPRGATNAFYEAVCERYFASGVYVNRYHLCILVHKAESPAEAIAALSHADAFATHVARQALLGVIGEARNTPWCKPEVLDALECYSTFAFVLSGTAMTCGTLPN